MSKRIYVGNLSYDATEDQIRSLFEEYGQVASIAMINDRDSGRFRGFCFVEMADAEADKAIEGLNDREIDGRSLRVNEARPREERGGGRRGGSGRGGDKRGNRGRRDDFPDSGGGRRW